MGCGSQYKRPELIRADTLIGHLKVVILEANFPTDTQLNVPFIKIRLSNQQHRTNTIVYGANRHQVDEHFTFFINSLYKGQGRAIQIAIFDKEDFIAYGAIDANPLVSKRKETQQPFRIILASDKNKKFGHITLRAHFQEISAQDLSFRFISATIRRKPGQKIAVRLTIGEQVLQTNFHEDQPESPPIWKDEMLVYKVPPGIQEGNLQLINSNGEVLGQTQINISDYINSQPNSQVEVSVELFYKQAQKQIDAANLRFRYILGEKASFAHQQKNILKSQIRSARNLNQFNPSYISRSNG